MNFIKQRRSFFVVCWLALIACALALVSCEREKREVRQSPPAAGLDSLTISDLRPGGAPPVAPTKDVYEERAYDLSQGKQLFAWYNCAGCHASGGGGGTGPPLNDDKWIYGSRPEQIFATIVEGRPNRMPAWRGKIPDSQVWQLVAYVRSLSGQVPKDAAPGRNDDMQFTKPEQSKPTMTPKDSSLPKSAEMPQ